MSIHDQEVVVNGFCFVCQQPKEEGTTHVCKLTPEDTKAIPVDAAIGMLTTNDEMMARRAITFLRGRFSIRDLGWFYKEGFYNVLVLGKPEEYHATEEDFQRIRQSILTICHTDLLQSAQLRLENFQEVSL